MNNSNQSIIPLQDWLKTDTEPLIISGPCSAETHDQMLETARLLAAIPQVKLFRAGIWKPRTRPSGFEGMGEKALEWMREIKQETGLRTTVEVATPEHVEKVLKYGIDVLWIGARTVVNPFSVQELAEALKGVDVPVFIKNPLNPDVKLWIGAIERMMLAGINKLAAIHRGFYYYKHELYRNQPMWEIPIDLQRLMPGLPIICDPSHIAGRRELLFDIAQKGLDLGMTGLMIESHIHPDKALTDAAQQLTPADLEKLLNRLTVRRMTGDTEFESTIEKLRRNIDKIDAELIDILAKRMRIVEEIGHYKKDNNIAVLQIRRWRQMIIDRLGVGSKMNLDREFLLKLLQLVHEESIRVQEEIMQESEIK